MTLTEKIKDKIEQLKGEVDYHENVLSVLNKLKLYIDIISDEQASKDLEEETKLYQLDNPVINHNNSVNRPLGWTTLEEAKQLVEAGLPVETADMCYPHFIRGGADSYDANPVPCSSLDYPYEMPCWSLGALLKLMPKTISVPVDERSACFYNLEWQFANDNSLRYIATNRGECLIDIYSDHDIGGKSFIETVLEMVVWLIENNYIKTQKK